MEVNGGAPNVKKIFLFEERSCRPSDSDDLIGLLHRWYGNSADVRSYDLAKPDELVPLPPALFFELQERGPACLPALVANGKVLSSGGLPTFDKAVELIEGQVEPARRAPAVPSTSCCPPAQGGRCC